jgi:hypothetical protein
MLRAGGQMLLEGRSPVKNVENVSVDASPFLLSALFDEMKLVLRAADHQHRHDSAMLSWS